MKTFNSRYLSYQEIAQEFVLTKNFQELKKCCHSILLGTRGCGKTTMLKMLHPYAVREYQKLYPEFGLDFYGVYIPADRQWSIILDQLSKETQNIAFYERVSRALVNVNILLAFIDTLKALFEDEQFDSSSKMDYLSLLVKAWKLDNTPPVLEVIRISLKSIIIDVKNAISESNFNYDFPFACKANFEDTISLAIEVFSSKFEFAKKKWALCFDEMEIAPSWLQDKIVNVCFRSMDQSILFKITATPDWRVQNYESKSPSESNDFEIIKCWNCNYSSIQDWKVFCDSVIEGQVLSKYKISQDDFFKLISDTQKQDLNFFFKKLPKVDKGFNAVFHKENYDEINGVIKIKNWIQRKAKYKYPILYCRYSWFTKEHQTSTPFENVYLGEWLLYRMADGNPRLFCNILDDIVLCLLSDKGKLIQRMPAIRDIIKSYSRHVFESSFFIQEEYDTEYGNFSFEEIVSKIGEFFQESLLSEDYNPYPVTFFSVSKKSSLQTFLKNALEQGLVIKVDDEMVGLIDGENGAYRLSYMLYPYFHIVQAMSKNIISLDEILKNKEK